MLIKMSLDLLLARQFINLVGKVADEFRLNISNDGWKLAVVDPANVVLIILDLPKDNFLYYEFDTDNRTFSIDGHPTSVSVGIDVDTIKNFLGKKNASKIICDEDLPVQFTFTAAEAERYQLEIKQGMFTREMLLLNISNIRREPKRPPKVVQEYRVQLTTNELIHIIKKASRVSTDVRFMFRRERDSVIFTAIALDDNDKPLIATKSVNEWNKLRDGARDSASSTFSLNYLSDIANVIPSEHLWISIGNDQPCVLQFMFGTTGQCEFLQAPRIEETE